MPVSINMPQRKQEADPLEKLANAVGIAKSIYGIYADSKTLDQALADKAKDREKRDAELEKVNRENARAKEESDPNSAVYQAMRAEYRRRTGEDAPEGMAYNHLQSVVQQLMKPKPEKDPLAQESLRVSIEERRRRMEEAKNGGKPTAEQSKAATFAKRLEQAEGVFSGLSDAGDKGTDIGTAVQRSRLFPEVFKQGAVKQRQQAERNFVNAILRRESGAAISPSEFENAEMQYFPRAGDDENVLAQKLANRQLALEGLKAEAGGTALDRIASQGSGVKAPAGGGHEQYSLSDIEAAIARKKQQARK